MKGKIRRIVTGHDSSGHSIVLSDAPAPAFDNPLRPGQVANEIWRTYAMPVPIAPDEPDPVVGPRQLHPTRGGTVLRISEIPPETEAVRNLSPERARELFGQIGNAGASTFAQSGRHPLMHRTQSVDYAVVLEGEIYLLLDDSEVKLSTGDVVIQRGTSHAWSNRSGKTVRMLYVLIDGEFDPALAAKLG